MTYFENFILVTTGSVQTRPAFRSNRTNRYTQHRPRDSLRSPPPRDSYFLLAPHAPKHANENRGVVRAHKLFRHWLLRRRCCCRWRDSIRAGGSQPITRLESRNVSVPDVSVSVSRVHYRCKSPTRVIFHQPHAKNKRTSCFSFQDGSGISPAQSRIAASLPYSSGRARPRSVNVWNAPADFTFHRHKQQCARHHRCNVGDGEIHTGCRIPPPVDCGPAKLQQ